MHVHSTEGWVHFDRMHHKFIGTDRHTKLPHKFVLVKERQKGLALPDLSRLPRSDLLYKYEFEAVVQGMFWKGIGHSPKLYSGFDVIYRVKSQHDEFASKTP